MSLDLILWLFILALFSVYGVLSGIELGVAMLRVEPRLAPALTLRRMFTPRLEVINLVLAIGVVGLVVLFEDAAAAILEATWPALTIGLLALILRAGLLLYLFLHKSTPGGKLLNYLFALVSFSVPLSLGSAGIYMVTGEPFWQTGVGATLFVSLLIGLLALAAGFIYYIGGKKAPQGIVLTTRVLNITLAGLLTVILLAVLGGGGSHLLNLSYAYLAVIAASIILLQAVLIAANKEWRMWWCLAVLAAMAPFLMGLANYPYLIFPYVMLKAVLSI